MAAEYHVRLGGKVHGPFTGSQLKKLAETGRIDATAEVRQGAAGKWYPAAKVKGLFKSQLDVPMPIESDAEVEQVEAVEVVKPARADRASSGSARRSSAPGGNARRGKVPAKKKAGSPLAAAGEPSAKRKRPAAKKRPPVVRAEDVFDLEAEAGEAVDDDLDFIDEFDEDEFLDGEPYDEFAPPRRSRGGGRGRRGGTAWNIVRPGLLLIGIAVCFYTANFGFQAVVELIGGLLLGTQSRGALSAGRTLEVLGKIGIACGFLGVIVGLVGYSLAILSPAEKGAKGLAIAALVTLTVHVVMSFLFVIRPAFGLGGSRNFGSSTFLFSGMTSGDVVAIYATTWLTFYASLILTCLLLRSLALVKKDRRHADDCLNMVWLIGAYVAVWIIAWIVGVILGQADARPTDRTTALVLFWLGFLLRLAHLSLYGIFIGKLIGNTFHSKSAM